MRHELAELALFVGVLDQVGLVDDVHQVARLGHSPEHAVDAEAQLPFPFTGLAEDQEIALAQVGMGTARVPGVVAKERL